MAQVTLHGNVLNTCGVLPLVGQAAPGFVLTSGALEEVGSDAQPGSKRVLNVFPSVDTPVCAASVRQFNARAAALEGVEVLCISQDLPFALGRFCGAEGLDKVTVLSAFRHPEFGQAYGLTIVDGPLAGLLARAVLVLNDRGVVVHAELVPEIAQEPDYEAAIKALS